MFDKVGDMINIFLFLYNPVMKSPPPPLFQFAESHFGEWISGLLWPGGLFIYLIIYPPYMYNIFGKIQSVSSRDVRRLRPEEIEVNVSSDNLSMLHLFKNTSTRNKYF